MFGQKRREKEWISRAGGFWPSISGFSTQECWQVRFPGLCAVTTDTNWAAPQAEPLDGKTELQDTRGAFIKHNHLPQTHRRCAEAGRGFQNLEPFRSSVRLMLADFSIVNFAAFWISVKNTAEKMSLVWSGLMSEHLKMNQFSRGKDFYVQLNL